MKTSQRQFQDGPPFFEEAKYVVVFWDDTQDLSTQIERQFDSLEMWEISSADDVVEVIQWAENRVDEAPFTIYVLDGNEEVPSMCRVYGPSVIPATQSVFVI